MRRIILVGSGNVATHLGIALKKSNYDVIQVYSRSIKAAKELAQKLDSDFTNNLTQIKKADLIIVSVNDDAISSVLSELEDTPIVHTSGSISINVFDSRLSHFGVLYPLQTFNKSINVTISDIPFCVEANTKKFEKQLVEIAKDISKTVVTMNSVQRKQLHIAAVFACNFSNHMYSIADDLLKEKDIDFNILLPLIKQSIAKIDANSPKTVQTGPAKRKDRKIIQQHIESIKNEDIKELYQKISDNIIQRNE